MCAACISSINQHSFKWKKGILIKESKKYCKCSKTFGRDCKSNYRLHRDRREIEMRLQEKHLEGG